MAITSEIIGKLGGADVEVMPVEGTVSGASGTSVVLAAIDIPAGEQWLVAAVGTMTNNSSSQSNWAQIEIGGAKSALDGPGGFANVATGAVSIRMVRNRTTGSDSFTGHVYTVKM